MNLCIIPARGGSKRIPRKNIREFCGKPMIAYPIEAAKKSKLFDHVVVSTDDDEIAEVAKSHGAETPFRRPPELADDSTPMAPVVIHAIRQSEKHFGTSQFVCNIYAATPLLRSEDINKSFRDLEVNNADFAFTVTPFGHPIQRALRKTLDNRVEMFNPRYRSTRSQDLEPAYHDAGQFYWGRAQAFLDGYDMFSERAIPYVLPPWRAIDIDSEDDWKHAELIFSALNCFISE